ncbi:NTP transferase domain-containing protein [Paenarthrobacter ureafaciens]|uniref:phosphocholine cytidylyltransferase family protein n=1 Tax=Paenarthrobacter ureafaciens TaxID=37931 RepID=UPI001408E4A6|nr:phosphocholine cytidylyltransferase family protein [Paenarthrobacter ureafaciens]MCX8453062.1 phosphocholine cytidylyltransferase family protein [Paenarthrobacter ureafaciens]MCY0972642.1 phosphocholine cytidylyltransferase family protein [Paenarthrobacter ureafaciens]QQQ61656.1 phosphocholine cytidylyltransferase family protein [Paenarthrobacter ureafaciens]
MTVQSVILAAGMGTRLARPHPKSLTELSDGRTIMHQQVHNLEHAFGGDLRLTVVVGYKLEQILEHVPHASFVYNENFDQTNTSKSLLKALRNSAEGGVLWMNGDVVFDPRILDILNDFVRREQSFVAVDVAHVSDEEVKYTVGSAGYIKELSKAIPAADAKGEAVGINYVSQNDKQKLIARLEEVDEQDYFERAIELSIELDGAQWLPVDISAFYAVEVDFPEDLVRANASI